MTCCAIVSGVIVPGSRNPGSPVRPARARSPYGAAILCLGLLAVIAGDMHGATAAAQTAPASPPKREKVKAGTPFAGFGSNSREPIKIDANKLEVFDKENRAVFTGDVVAVQGQTTMRCSVMTVVYAQSRNGASDAAAPRSAAPAGQNAIKEIDCAGPVSLLSGTQSATSGKLVYNAAAETITLTGKVVIADCDNVQRGERAVYDVKTGKATVDAGPKGRVQGVFTPGNDDKKGASAKSPRTECGPAAPAPKAAAPAEKSSREAAPRPLQLTPGRG